MSKRKKAIKAKDPVKIRFKELVNGNRSIYLDIYQNGKRSYEFLKLYLIPETDRNSKAQNRNTLQAAEAIKSQRLLELINGKAYIVKGGSKMLLSEWIGDYSRKSRLSLNSARTYIKVLKIVLSYRDVMLKDIDKAYCLGFMDYLRNGYISRLTKKNLSQSSASLYVTALSTVLKAAVREDLLQVNPFDKIAPSDKIAKNDRKRCFLEVDEVKRLISTPYDINPGIKQAFLFQCFSGLRISDIKALTWGNVIMDSKRPHLEITMQKTKRNLDIDLSESALRWLPDRGEASENDKVFSNLPAENTVNINLRKWAESAGIKKHITTHVARHTFATMSLTAGVDLYTTSKMLGHTNISVTQIYADIINQKKQEAVAKISNLFSNDND